MAWTIEFSELAKKNLSKLDKPVAKRILKFLEERIASNPDSRSLGESLTGSELGEFWKYRVGALCLICSMQEDKLIVYVLKIGHRREVYR